MPTDPDGRALRLLAELQRLGSASAAELAAELGVSARTIRRDTERLRQLGHVIGSRPGPGSGYHLEGEQASLSSPVLTPEEFAAVVRALQAGRSGDPAAASALRKFGGSPTRPTRCLLYCAFSTVRARIPSVALMLVSGMTGKSATPR